MTMIPNMFQPGFQVSSCFRALSMESLVATHHDKLAIYMKFIEIQLDTCEFLRCQLLRLLQALLRSWES